MRSGTAERMLRRHWNLQNMRKLSRPRPSRSTRCARVSRKVRTSPQTSMWKVASWPQCSSLAPLPSPTILSRRGFTRVQQSAQNRQSDWTMCPTYEPSSANGEMNAFPSADHSVMDRDVFIMLDSVYIYDKSCSIYVKSYWISVFCNVGLTCWGVTGSMKWESWDVMCIQSTGKKLKRRRLVSIRV